VNGEAGAWRPPPIIRPIAIGVVLRHGKILVMAIRDADGRIKGWRPPGGAIELGERAAEALRREFLEELGAPITEPEPLAVLENIYTHNGAPGHEIVFVLRAHFIDPGACRDETFVVKDAGADVELAWIDCARFKSGSEQLFPAGLLQRLVDEV
jgi:ADP-ribose pyrophosphatase YjhB (NUDIX family)